MNASSSAAIILIELQHSTRCFGLRNRQCDVVYRRYDKGGAALQELQLRVYGKTLESAVNRCAGIPLATDQGLAKIDRTGTIFVGATGGAAVAVCCFFFWIIWQTYRKTKKVKIDIECRRRECHNDCASKIWVHCARMFVLWSFVLFANCYT
ncbi:hypothetical protein BV898_18972 [Hypsibius exemplaris]|uniref:Uncharacterized protein n=1 Tax=Hypsibius exemplaris TaxID=2072580 RepID=A0A9X6NIP8_HYPEX|nr:hypothetical protein BV898_18972 [Hypsibius exemplaris]